MNIVTPRTNFVVLLAELIDYFDRKADYKNGQFNQEAKLMDKCAKALRELEKI